MVVSDESGSIGYNHNGNDNVNLQPPLLQQQHQQEQQQEEQESPIDNSHSSMSGKQNSIFSLTLDEIQCKSGRSFGSMNMDEFLANIWNVEENQGSSQPPNNHKGDQDSVNDKDTTSPQPAPHSQQGSFSIPTPLCKKTVDEVWSEIDKSRPQQLEQPSNIANSGPPQRQPTIGEITLEDFLVKAGVVQESPNKSKPSQNIMATPIPQQCGSTTMIPNSSSSSSSTCLDTNFGMGQVIGSGYLNHLQNAVPNNFSGNGYANATAATYPMFGQSTKMVVGEPSFVSNSSAIEKCHSLPESSGGSKKKRIIDGPPEVVVERRQRRMIKNRESAARSRARKQAYTVELEAEWNQLQVENEQLKQSVAESEQRRRQEVMTRKQSTRAHRLAEKLRTIRRVASLTW